MAQSAVELLGAVTPRMLLQVFPVTKEYDGDRWECKDYFYTMRALKEYSLDTPLGENVLHVLWDYMNPHVTGFMIWIMGAIGEVQPLVKPKPKMPRWWRVIEGGLS